MSRVNPVPVRASHPINCEKGAKHIPSTRETRYDGRVLKYVVCTKCDKSLS